MRKDSKKRIIPVQYGEATLKPCEKFHLKSDFAYVRESGTKLAGRYMLLVSAPSLDDNLRFGIVCGKKFSKKAVLRNRAKRLLKESFRLVKSRVRPCCLTFVARQYLKNRSLSEVQQEMIALLKQADLWEKEG